MVCFYINKCKEDYRIMPLKRNDTYEYRSVVKRPDLKVKLVEIGCCKENVLLKELKKPCNGRFYHTEDTNRFFFDFNDKRYELNLFGDGGGSVIDLSDYAKKTDLPKKVSQLENDSKYITLQTVKSFLFENDYVTLQTLVEKATEIVNDELNSIRNEIEVFKERVDDIDFDSDSYDSIRELNERVSALESAVADEETWEEFVRE